MLDMITFTCFWTLLFYFVFSWDHNARRSYLCLSKQCRSLLLCSWKCARKWGWF